MYKIVGVIQNKFENEFFSELENSGLQLSQGGRGLCFVNLLYLDYVKPKEIVDYLKVFIEKVQEANLDKITLVINANLENNNQRVLAETIITLIEKSKSIVVVYTNIVNIGMSNYAAIRFNYRGYFTQASVDQIKEVAVLLAKLADMSTNCEFKI